MSDELHHEPVMLGEVLEAMQLEADACVVDATFGRGGHARAVLERLGSTGHLWALDRDPVAVAAARALEEDDARANVRHASFATLAEQFATEGLTGRVDAVLLDLGVSSPQLDDPARGFSFRLAGPLDMRMDPDTGRSAGEWINAAPVDELARVFRELGDERHARRIARAIGRARAAAPIETTTALAEVVARAHPAWERERHPATRVFLATRMHINDELGELERGLEAGVQALAPHGRLVVIAFHSVEDRVVKRFMRRQSRGEPMPRKMPLAGAPPAGPLRVLGRPRFASAGERERNPRARSAVMRVAERAG